MKTVIFSALLVLLSTLAFSQQLRYKSNGNVYDSENNRVTPSEMRELLATKPGMLEFYNSGRTKKTAGNILLLAGSGLVVADLLTGLTADANYPGTLTFLGAASMIIAIPVKAGYSKKIQTVVNDYNKEIANSDLKIDTVTLYANGNGAGIRLTF